MICWEHIEDINKRNRPYRNRKPTNRYNPDVSGEEQAKRKIAGKSTMRRA